jgi:hypothetical protein
VRTGDPVELIGLGAAVKSVVTSVETFGKTMDSAWAGNNAAPSARARSPPCSTEPTGAGLLGIPHPPLSW